MGAWEPGPQAARKSSLAPALASGSTGSVRCQLIIASTMLFLWGLSYLVIALLQGRHLQIHQIIQGPRYS
jgi:hypothetical protein